MSPLQSYKKNNPALHLAVGCLVVCYPIGAVTNDYIRDGVILILITLSIFYCSFFRQKTENNNCPRREIYLLGSFVLFFCVALVSYFFSGMEHIGLNRLGIYSLLFFGVPLYFLFKNSPVNYRLIWYGITIGAITVGLVALSQSYKWTDNIQFITRASGTVHIIRFGNIALLLGFLSLAGVLYLPGLKIPQRIFGIAGSAMGLLASILSGTRGGWIAVPLLILILLYKAWPVWTKKTRIITICILIVLPIGLFNIQALSIIKRIQVVWPHIQHYQPGEYLNPTSQRLELNRAALALIEKNPILGVGTGNYKRHVDKLADNPNLNFKAEIIKQFRNPHNEYLLVWVTRGLPGILSLLFLFGSGIWIFGKELRKKGNENLFPAVSGLIIVAGYMHFGLTIALFEHRAFTAFYVFFIMLMAANLRHKESVVTENQSDNTMSQTSSDSLKSSAAETKKFVVADNSILISQITKTANFVLPQK